MWEDRRTGIQGGYGLGGNGREMPKTADELFFLFLQHKCKTHSIGYSRLFDGTSFNNIIALSEIQTRSDNSECERDMDGG